MKTTTRSPLADHREWAVRIALSNRAFSLPELLIALVVSGLLVTGIAAGYIVQKRSAEGEAGMKDMLMNGRLAIDRTAEVIRNAGLGCKDNFPPKDSQTLQGAFNNYAQIFTVQDRSDGPDVLTVVTGLRRLTVVESLGADYVVVKEIKNANNVPFFDTAKNRYIFFSPQGENRFLEVLGVDENTRELRLSDPCTNPGDESCGIRVGDSVFRVNAFTITLDQNGDDDQDPIDVDGDGTEADHDVDLTLALDGTQKGTPDLYIYSNTLDLVPDGDLAGAGEANVSSAEVAEGIEALQFRYGWDANQNGEIEEAEFVDDPTGHEGDIRAVRIFLLARTLSADPTYTDPNPTYTLANQTVTLGADDLKYHRQLFIETVMVRNLNL